MGGGVWALVEGNSPDHSSGRLLFYLEKSLSETQDVKFGDTRPWPRLCRQPNHYGLTGVSTGINPLNLAAVLTATGTTTVIIRLSSL